ncbi:hypothetical protein QFZ58_004342 [Streptomyces sp. B1I3]|nr:hypothetical protein [Streptomyces sp. B1I3]
MISGVPAKPVVYARSQAADVLLDDEDVDDEDEDVEDEVDAEAAGLESDPDEDGVVDEPDAFGVTGVLLDEEPRLSFR